MKALIDAAIQNIEKSIAVSDADPDSYNAGFLDGGLHYMRLLQRQQEQRGPATLLTPHLYALLETSLKMRGTYEPSEALCFIEDKLTVEEYDGLSGFLQWVHDNGKHFGHGNYNEVYAEYLSQKG